MELFIRTLLPVILVSIRICGSKASDPTNWYNQHLHNTGYYDEEAERLHYLLQAETSQPVQTETYPNHFYQTQQHIPHPEQPRSLQLNDPNQSFTVQLPAAERRKRGPRQNNHEAGTSQTGQTRHGPRPRMQDPAADALHGLRRHLLERPFEASQVQVRTPNIREQMQELQAHLQGETHGQQLAGTHTSEGVEGQIRRLEQEIYMEHPQAQAEVMRRPTIITCFGHTIRAIVASINFGFKTLSCEIIAEPPFNNYIPSIEYRNDKFSYATCECRQDHARCITYRDAKANVLGTKPAPKSNEVLDKDDPARLIPDQTTSYITCNRKEFKVTLHPVTKIVEDIQLYPKNRRKDDPGEKKNFLHETKHTCCGVHFLSVRTPNSVIVGARLDPLLRPQLIFRSS